MIRFISLHENEVVVHEGRILTPHVAPCNFCLTDDSLLELWGVNDHVEVRCFVCGHKGPHGRDKLEAIAFWNTANSPRPSTYTKEDFRV